MKKNTYRSSINIIIFAITCLLSVQACAEPLTITGSSTAAPFLERLAQKMTKNNDMPDPIIYVTGTGKGLDIFCSNKGVADITGASRRIKPKEIRRCKKNNINPYEIIFGFDGVVIAQHTKHSPNMTSKDLFLALAAKVPDPQGKTLIPNPYHYWDEINRNLPHQEIIIYGGPKGSGTRDTIEHTLMKKVSREIPAYQEHGYSIFRDDGVYIDDQEDHEHAIAMLNKNPSALGIFGYSYYFEHQDSLKAMILDDIGPNPQTIATMTYSLARPLYIYLKDSAYQNKQPVYLFTQKLISHDISGANGLFDKMGLIPLPDSMLKLIPFILDHKMTLKEYSLH